MKTFASKEALTARLSVPVTDTDEPRLGALLEDATTVILTYLGRDDWDDWENIPRGLELACISVAQRVYLNPLSITSETYGDTSMRRSSASVVGLALNDSEKLLVDQAAGHVRVQSVRFDTGVTDEDRDTWSPEVRPGLREMWWA